MKKDKIVDILPITVKKKIKDMSFSGYLSGAISKETRVPQNAVIEVLKQDGLHNPIVRLGIDRYGNCL